MLAAPRSLAQRLGGLFVSLACVAGLMGMGAIPGGAREPPDLTGVWTLYSEPGTPPLCFGAAGGPGFPLKPEAQAKVDAYRALVAPTGDNPGAHCLGSGMPCSTLGAGAYPMEIVQKPDKITIIHEAHNELRHIYFGSRVIPEADRLPDRNGYSVGHWEGTTLVVETNNLREQVDQQFAHSANATIVERFHRETDSAGNQLLVVEMTMTDPDWYTDPVTVTKKWALEPNGHLLPYECNEPAWTHHLESLEAASARN